MKKSFLGFLVAIALGACSSEEGGGDGAIVLDGETQTSQTVYADETQKNEGIKFTAIEPWTATVNEVKTRAEGSSNVDWLKLSAYNGEAGEFTLNLTLNANTSGKSRKAEIRIAAGKTVLTITVEQKAETENGENGATVLKNIKKITYKLEDKADLAMGYKDYMKEELRAFSYDDKGRVVRLVSSSPYYTEVCTMNFDYTIAGEITIREKDVNSDTGNVKYEDTYIAKLNEQGNAVNLQTDDKNTGKFSDYLHFGYTSDNRLAYYKDVDAGTEASQLNLSYSNGLLSKLEYTDGKNPEDNFVSNFDMTKVYANRYPNNAPVDIMWLFADGDDYDFLFLIGRLGKTSDCLPETFLMDEGGYLGCVEEASAYLNPNVTIKNSYTSIKIPKQDMVMSYTFDKDKRLTGISAKQTFSVMETTYDIMVGDKLIDPEYPERGYQFTRANEKTTKVKDDVNVRTWTIEY